MSDSKVKEKTSYTCKYGCVCVCVHLFMLDLLHKNTTNKKHLS